MAFVSKIDGRRDSQSNTKVAPSATRPSSGASVIDVLDHVLDKGIVIDAWMKVSLVGIDLLTVEARVLVASIETYLQQAEAVSHFGALAAGQLAGGQLASQPGPKISHTPGRRRS
jgi:Gas vesicle protein